MARCHPNLKEVWKALRDKSLVTVAYPTFVAAYREAFDEEVGPPTADLQPPTPGDSQKSVAASTSKRRAVPEQTIGSFRHDPHPGDLEW